MNWISFKAYPISLNITFFEMKKYTSIFVRSLTCICDMAVLKENDYLDITLLGENNKGNEVIDCM